MVHTSFKQYWNPFFAPRSLIFNIICITPPGKNISLCYNLYPDIQDSHKTNTKRYSLLSLYICLCCICLIESFLRISKIGCSISWERFSCNLVWYVFSHKIGKLLCTPLAVLYGDMICLIFLLLNMCYYKKRSLMIINVNKLSLLLFWILSFFPIFFSSRHQIWSWIARSYVLWLFWNFQVWKHAARFCR